MALTENPEYERVFAIVRIDLGMIEEFGMKPDYITVKAILREEQAAEHEAERLNRINADKAILYSIQPTRLERALANAPHAP